jgi:hypothetical protein
MMNFFCVCILILIGFSTEIFSLVEVIGLSITKASSMSAEEIFKDLGVSVKSKSVDLNWRMI